MCYFEVSDFYSIWHIVIPHFLNYPFYGIKQSSFKRYVHALTLLYPYYNKDKPKLLLGKLIYLAESINPSPSPVKTFELSLVASSGSEDGLDVPLRDFQSEALSPGFNSKSKDELNLNAQTPPSLTFVPMASEIHSGHLALAPREAEHLACVSPIQATRLQPHRENGPECAISAKKNRSQRLYKLINIKPSEVIKELKDLSNINNYFDPLTSINVFFIIGVIEGDGCFYIGLRDNRKIRFGFNITTHIHELDLLYKIKWVLNCGITKIKTKTWCRYEIEGAKSLRTILIPLINSIPLLSSKSINFKSFKEAMEIYTKKEHLTDKGLIRLAELAYNNTTKGTKRKNTLQEYLKKNNLSSN